MARGRTFTLLPGAQIEGVGTDQRRTKYGEDFAIALDAGTNYPHAMGGTYYNSMTATPGTPYNLAGATQTAFVATTPTVTLYNGNAAGGKSVYLDFIQIVYATAGSAGTRVEGAIVGDVIDRYSSGGTALVNYNVNTGVTTASSVVVKAGAITAAAASAATYLGRFTLSTAIPAAGETYRIEFGAPLAAGHTSKIARVGPVIVAPTDSVVVYTWSPSQSATPTAEITVGWWER